MKFKKIFLIFFCLFMLSSSLLYCLNIISSTTAKVKAGATNPNKITPKLQKGLILDLPLQEPYTEASGNLVSNGRFDTDTDWSKGAGWTINDGKASIDGSQTGPSYLIPEPNVYIEANKKYFLSLSIPDCSSSYLRFRANDEILNTPNITSSGEFSFVFSSKYSGVFKIEASGLFIGSIDNVIIKELNGTTQDRTPNQNKGTVSGATLKHDGLVNVSDGVAYIPSTTAYGTWEWDFRLSSSGNHFISFIDANNTGNSGFTGYYLLFNSNYRIYLAKANDGGSIEYMFNTADNYVALDTDYKLKITRSLAGNFGIYIKGGEYGWDDWTLVDDSVTGELDYTVSNYFNTEFRAGDTISNLKIDGKPISLAKATQSTGTWTTTAPSYEFDGTDDYIDLGSKIYLDYTKPFSLSFWAYPQDIRGSNIVINLKCNDVKNWLLFFIDTENYKHITFGNGMSFLSKRIINDAIVVNNYYNVILTYDGSMNYEVYLNNSKQVVVNSANIATVTTNNIIGKTNSSYFDGQISNLKIWNRALSAEEIDYLYNKEKVNYK